MAEYIRMDCLWKCETCFYHRGGKCSTWCDAGESYRPAYSALKSFAIDAEPVKHARWIGIEYDGYADGNPVYDLWECSECGEELCGYDVPDMNPYCRKCGAKMDLEV